MTATITRLIPRQPMMACPGKVRVAACVCGQPGTHWHPCGFIGPVKLVEAAAYCPWCGKILRWPRDVARPA